MDEQRFTAFVLARLDRGGLHDGTRRSIFSFENAQIIRLRAKLSGCLALQLSLQTLKAEEVVYPSGSGFL